MLKCNVNPKLTSKSQELKEQKACKHTVLAEEIKKKEFPAELYSRLTGVCQD